MSTFQPDSLHPYIMDERLKKATGSGGIGNIPIASADTVGGIMIGGSANPITITGSGNASIRKATSELLGVVKAGDGISVDADGAISGVAYSTTEHKTGRKWIDNKDIYEISYDYAITTSGANVETGLIVPDFDNIVNFFGTVNNGASINYGTEINVILDTDRQIKLKAPAWAVGSHMLITYQYTKPTTP